MTITTTVLEDTAEYTKTLVVDTVKKSEATTIVYKPGSPVFNQQALIAKAQNARANNSAFLALASPTQAQAVAQVQALTRQMNALILITLESFTDVSDT